MDAPPPRLTCPLWGSTLGVPGPQRPSARGCTLPGSPACFQLRLGMPWCGLSLTLADWLQAPLQSWGWGGSSFAKRGASIPRTAGSSGRPSASPDRPPCGAGPCVPSRPCSTRVPTTEGYPQPASWHTGLISRPRGPTLKKSLDIISPSARAPRQAPFQCPLLSLV